MDEQIASEFLLTICESLKKAEAKFVSGVEEATAHINKYVTMLSEAGLQNPRILRLVIG